MGRQVLVPAFLGCVLFGLGWVLGSNSSRAPKSESDPARLDAQLSALKASIDAAISALHANQPEESAETTRSTSSKTQDGDVSTGPVRESDVDRNDEMVKAIKKCFEDYWRYTAGSDSEIAYALRRSGRSPFDDGAERLISDASRQLVAAMSKYSQDETDIKSRYPALQNMWNGIAPIPEQKAEFDRQLKEYAAEHNARDAAYMAEKNRILQDLGKSVSEHRN